MSAMTLPAPRTANQRLKEGFEFRLALSLVAATLLHALLFDLWPSMEVAAWKNAGTTPTEVVRMEATDLPAAPKALRRPAAPEPSPLALPDETWDQPTWEEVPALAPPAPKVTASAESGSEAWFGPVTVQPSLANPDEMRQALEREYPSILRDAGIGGVVYLLMRIDTRGRVMEAKVDGSSGHAGLDAAALRVAHILRFHPAINRHTPVSVWVRIPVKFEVHGRPEVLEAGRANR